MPPRLTRSVDPRLVLSPVDFEPVLLGLAPPPWEGGVGPADAEMAKPRAAVKTIAINVRILESC